MDPDEVQHINWVAKPSDLSSVNEHIGAVLNSHVIEHWNGNHGNPLVNLHFPGSDRIDRMKIAIDSFYENNEKLGRVLGNSSFEASA
jgi:hypothetical protein